MGQGVVVFVRLMVMPPAETATLAGLSALERAAALSGARRRSRTGNVLAPVRARNRVKGECGHEHLWCWWLVARHWSDASII